MIILEYFSYFSIKTYYCIKSSAACSVLPGPRTSIVSGSYVCETSVKRRNKIHVVQEITQNVADVFSFYAIIAIEHGFSMH